MHTTNDRRAADRAVPAADASRLRALDAMLGGVAHDLNNALSVVLMNLDIMQQDPNLSERHARRLEGMVKATARASSLVRHMLNFSHSRRPAPEVTSIAEAVPPLVALVQAALGKDISVRAVAADVGPCCAIVDHAAFEVAIVHLALQLAEALPAGSELVFTVSRECKTSPRDGSRDRAHGDEVLLAVHATPAGVTSGGDRTGFVDGGVDLAIVEEFARAAGGRAALTDAGGVRRVSLHLPNCEEVTAI